MDGRLDDQPWRRASAITEFLQKEPIEGATPTERMDVRFAYDATGLYVSARMYSRDPRMIQAPLGRRDEVATQSENIIVSLDTFLDRRTAYSFGVSASGVRLDRFHPQDDETRFDAGFDPVWEVQTNIDEQGWTAEFWIPFSQLRFQRAGDTDLGIEHTAVHADAPGRGLLGPRASNRARLGVPFWRAPWDRVHPPDQACGTAAVYRWFDHERQPT